jgi:hypothetical protein
MKYLLLIYHKESDFNGMTETDREQMYGEYRALREQLISRGQFIDGSRLQSTTTATSVRIREGKDLVIDGPFAETHEQLGGYFMINVDTVDEAVAIAKQIPSAQRGTVEVRPLAVTTAEAHA